MDETEIKQMRKSFDLVKSRTEVLTKEPRVQKLRERVTKIRKNAIAHNEELIEEVKESFDRNDIDYYFAEDGDEALDIIYRLIEEYDPEDKRLIKSKSNTWGEISGRSKLEARGVTVVETDLGDRLLQLKGHDNRLSHNTVPAAHLSINEIVDIVNNALNVNIPPDHQTILETVRADVKEHIAKAQVGLTGANAISAEDGSLSIVHNEYNVAYASSRRLHIVLAGIDKLVPTAEDCISVCKLDAVYGIGAHISSYINTIAGPSKTADIENKILKPMYGAERVVVVFLDNGRSKAREECLWCINCGNCVVSCPVYNSVGNDFGFNYYLGGRGIAMSRYLNEKEDKDDKQLYMCTLCGNCTLNCPVATPTNKVMEDLRSETKYHMKPHIVIKDNIEENGTPYNDDS